ncbi:MAG: ABC transporter permease [archaeon]
MNRIGLYWFSRREVHRFLKVINQTVFPPIVSSLLYIAVFHFVLGRSGGTDDYLAFLVPGLVMMAMVTNAFSNSSSSLFISKWSHHIGHLLTMPLSYLELTLGYIIGAITRGIVSGAGIIIVLAFLVPVGFAHPFIALLYLFIGCFLFGALGILAALWADQFDHLGIFSTFIITPLTMLGGVFYSIQTLPETFRTATLFNPVFYLVDGFRYGMVGVNDAPIWLGILVTGTLSAIVFAVVIALLRAGYKIRS